MLEFRKAIESKDLDALQATLSDDVIFCSPAVHKPYAGKAETMVILRAVMTVFEEFRYTRVFEGPEGGVLVFDARVGDRQVQGADFLQLGDDGLIDNLTVMIRPLSGLNAVVAAMAPAIEEILAGLSP